jgi:hypothetical protein
LRRYADSRANQSAAAAYVFTVFSLSQTTVLEGRIVVLKRDSSQARGRTPLAIPGLVEPGDLHLHWLELAGRGLRRRPILRQRFEFAISEFE